MRKNTVLILKSLWERQYIAECLVPNLTLLFMYPKVVDGTCEEIKAASRNGIGLPESVRVNYEKRVKGKSERREERQKDRSNHSVAVLCFDLENIFSLPKGNVSAFCTRNIF